MSEYTLCGSRDGLTRGIHIYTHIYLHTCLPTYLPPCIHAYIHTGPYIPLIKQRTVNLVWGLVTEALARAHGREGLQAGAL